MNRSILFEALEQRILFSADPFAVANGESETVISNLAGIDSTAQEIANLLGGASTLTSTDLHVPDTKATESTTVDTLGLADHHSAMDAPAESLPSDDLETHLVVIDGQVDDLESLLNDITIPDNATLEILVLDQYQDGIQQLTDTLSQMNNVGAVHIVSHGADGVWELGRSQVSSNNIDQYENQLTSWRDALLIDADILLYGCDLAASERGIDLLEAIGNYTGADIAASTDVTGHTSLDGNWNLEYTIGEVDTAIAFSDVTVNNWHSTLAITANIIGHWELNGTAVDSSPTSNDGVFHNAAYQILEDGNHAANLYGDPDPNDLSYIEIPGNTAYSATGGDFTISFWFRQSSLTTQSELFQATDGIDETRFYLDSNDNIYWTVTDNSGNTASLFASVPNTGWHLITGTRTGDDFQLYVDDGPADGSQSRVNVNADLSNATITLGATNATSNDFDGNIKDVRIYDSALSTTDNDELFQDAPAGTLPTLEVDTTDDYGPSDSRWGDTSSLGGLLTDKGSDGLISLREAISAANSQPGPTGISLKDNTYELTEAYASPIDDNSNGDLDIQKDIVIGGTGADASIISGTNNGTSTQDRIFDVRNSSTLVLNNLTVQGGDSPYAGSAIDVPSGSTLEIYNSIVRDNITAAGDSGAINTSGTTNISSTSFINNVGDHGGAIGVKAGTTTIINSTFSGNEGRQSGGAIRIQGGTVNLNYSTIAENLVTGDRGGGIINNSTLNIANSIVANNQAVPGDHNIKGTYTDNGNNIIGDDTGPPSNPGLLEPLLQDPASGQWVYPITSSSAAYEGVGSGATMELDQRGEPRTAPYDIGAYESDTPVSSGPPASPPPVLVINAPYSTTVDEDTTLNFSGADTVQVDDGITNDVQIQVALSIANGRLNFPTTNNLIIVSGANNSANIVLDGLESDINAALASMQFIPDPDYFGSTTLNIELGLNGHLNGLYTFDSGDASDTSQGSWIQNGSLEGGATVINDAERGNVISLDGIDDYVLIPSDFGKPNSVSIGGWVNLAAGSAPSEFISIDNRVLVRLDQAEGVKAYFGVTATTYEELPSGVSIAGTGWRHVFYTVDTTAGSHTLYIDGVEVATATSSAGIHWGYATATRIGHHNVDGNFLSGSVDSVRIHTKAVTADEVLAFYNESESTNEMVQIDVQAVDDPPIIDLDADNSTDTDINYSGTFVEAAAPVNITDTDVDITDVDSTELESATIVITNLLDGADESLSVTLPDNTWNSSYDNTLGALTITKPGGAPHSDWITVYESVQYDNTSQDPDTTTRNITVEGQEGAVSSNPLALAFIEITPFNDAPVISISGNPITTVGGTKIITPAMLSELDPDDDDSEVTFSVTSVNNGQLRLVSTGANLNSFTANQIATNDIEFVHDGLSTQNGVINLSLADGGEDGAAPDTDSLVITIIGALPDQYATNEDSTLNMGANNGLLANDTQTAGATVYAVNQSMTNGTVTWQSDGSFLYQQNGVHDYLSVGQTATDTFEYTYDDGNGNRQTTSVTLTIDGLNDAPALSGIENTAAQYTENNTGVALTGNLSVTDIDSTNLDSATVSITGNFVSGEDSLTLPAQSNITGNYDATNGVLTLTGTASVAEYESAIHSITYSNNSDNPSTLTRTVDIVVNDGSLDSLSSSRTIEITPVNDAPLMSNNTGTDGTVGASTTITSAMLSATDLDDSDTDLTYNVSNVVNGQLELSSNAGVAISTFTQADINSGVVQFVHNGISANDGSFDFSLADGGEDNAAAETGSFIVSITGASPDAYNADENTPLNVNAATGVLANDTPGTVPVSDDSNTTGTVSVNTDGSFTYSANGQFESLATGQTATDTFDYTHDDGNGSTQVVTVTITVNGSNDAPTLNSLEAAPAYYIENSSGVGLTGSISVADVDDNNLESATVSISNNFIASEDALSLPTQPNIIGIYDAATGVLALNGSATVAEYESAIQSISYTNSSDNPSTQIRTVDIVVNDGDSDSYTRSRDIEILPRNDAPTLTNIEGSAASYTENSTGIVVSNTISVDDVDNTQIESASVRITNNYQPTEDLLILPSQPNITGTYSGNNGKLTLTGPATVAEFEAALQAVTYRNASDDPSTLTRTIEFVVNDGQYNSAASTRAVDIIAVNDSPALLNNTGAASAVGATTTITTAMLNESDLDDDGNELTYTVTSTTAGTIQLNGSPSTSFTQADIDNNNVSFLHTGSANSDGSFDFQLSDGGENGSTPVSDTFSLNVIGAMPDNYTGDEDTTLNINAASGLLTNDTTSATAIVSSIDDSATIGQVSYSSDGSFSYDPNGAFESLAAGQTTTDSFDYTYDDGNGNTQTVTVTINIDGVNDAPGLRTMEGHVASYSEGKSDVIVTGSLSIVDYDNSDIQSATIAIVSNFVANEDVLSFNDQAGITGNYDLNTGVLQLTGTASAADYQTALRSIIYLNNSQDPSSLNRTVEFTVNDGLDSDQRSRQVAVSPVNNPPVVSINTGANSLVGATTVITDAMLNESDPDDDGTELTYDVTLVSHGQIELVSNPSTAITAFTQADIDNNNVVFVHDGLSDNDGSFEFTLKDGGEDSYVPLLANDPTLGYNANTGSIYRWVNSPTDFNTALDAATTDVLNGVAGKLVTVDSAFENHIVHIWVQAGGHQIWLGASDADNEGTWNWLDGTVESNRTFQVNGNDVPGVYASTMWLSAAPNENYIRMIENGDWSDESIFGGAHGYVVEWTGSEVPHISPTETFVINVAGAVADAYSTDEASTISMPAPGLLANDSSGASPTVSSIDQTNTAGSVSYNADGSFDYQPNGAFESLKAGQTAIDTFDYTYSDNNGIQQTVTATITISGINDAPTLTNIEATPANYTENANAVGITGNLTLADVDDAQIETATISISNNFVAAEDSLVFIDQLGITGNYNTANGILTLTGPASVADFETAIQSIGYQNSSDAPSTLTRSVDIEINDGDATSNLLTRDIAVVPVNDAPQILINSGAGASVGGTTTISSAMLNENDPDDSGAELTYNVSSVSNGQLELTTNPGTGITSFTQADIDADLIVFVHDGASTQNGSFDFSLADGGENNAAPVTGTFIVSVSGALPDQYNTDEDSTLTVNAPGLLSNDSSASGFVAGIITSNTAGSVTFSADGSFNYQPDSSLQSLETGQTATDSFEYTYDDGNSNQQTATVTITITGVNDAPILASIEPSSANYIENGSPVNLTSSLSISDIDDTLVETATITISNNFVPNGDFLSFSNLNGISGSYNASLGVLTMTGPATHADFETAMRSVTFHSIIDSHANLSRTVEFTINDSEDNSTVVTRDIQITAVNDAPVLSGIEATAASYTENDTPTTFTDTLLVTDIDDSNIESASVLISSNFVSSEDILSFSDQLGISGSYDASTGVLNLVGSAALSDYQTAIRSITYHNTSDNPSSAPRTIDIIIDDGDNSSNLLTRNIEITPSNDAPQLANIEALAANFIENSNGVGITGNLSVADIDDNNIESALISISGNFNTAEDELLFTDQLGISGNYDQATGVLSLVGSAPLADYETAIHSIIYNNSSNNPSTTMRTVEITVSDGDTDSNTITRNISFNTVNDAPVITAIETTPLQVSENDPASVISSSIEVSDADDIDIESATVSISSGFTLGEDMLAYSGNANITSNFNPFTGTLSLTGPASVADFEAALRLVTYSNNSDNPSTQVRTITLTVNDGDSDSNSTSRDIEISAVNDAPILSSIEGAATVFTENTPPTIVTGNLNVDDPDNTTINSATIAINGNFDTNEDELNFTDQTDITGNYDSISGTLTLSGAASLSDYQAAIRTVTYSNNSEYPSTQTRSVDITINDGILSSNTLSRNIDVIAVNDAPVLSAIEINQAEFTENSTPLSISSSLLISDVDHSVIDSATVSISGNFVAAEDELNFIDQSGITGSYDSAAGTLTLTGVASLTDYQSALRNVTYSNNSDNPTTQVRTITLTVNDGDRDSNITSRDIKISAVNDAPILSSIEGAATVFTENTPPIIVTGNLNVDDPDNTVINSATIAINQNFEAAEDELNFTDQAGITGIYDSAAGTLTLTGVASLTDYQAAIRTVTYSNNSENPSTQTRSVDITINDGILSSNTLTRNINLIAVNDAPVLSAIELNQAEFIENSTPLSITSSLLISDVDHTVIDSATVSISGNFEAAEDELNFTDQAGITGIYDSAAGTLTLSGVASLTDYQAAIGTVTYSNSSENPSTQTRSVDITINDGILSSNTLSRNIDVIAVNDAPVISAIEIDQAEFIENSSPLSITSSLLISDIDHSVIDSATVSISSNFVAGEDQLSFVDQAGISGSFNANTGELTLNGQASIADYETAIHSITFSNNSDNPTTGLRTVTINVNDGQSTSNALTRNILVSAVNDAPVLSGIDTLAAVFNENGTAISITDTLTIADVDDAQIESADIIISGGYNATEDSLAFIDQLGISGTFDTANGTLSLTGSATLADYETALRSVTYANSSANPSMTARTIDITVNDGQNDNDINNSWSRQVVINATDNAPVLSNLETTPLVYTENDLATGITTTITTTDLDDTMIQSAVVAITQNHNASEDSLIFTDTPGISGTYDATAGTLTLSGAASLSDYQAALQSVSYQNNSDNPNTAARTIEYSVSNSSVSNTVSRSITVVAINDAPILSNLESGALSYTENGLATLLTSSISISDSDNNLVESAAIEITNNYVAGQDWLAFTNQNGIVGNFDQSSGILSLTGSATLSDYEAALRSITYINTDENPSTQTRTVAITVHDTSDINSESNSTSRDITVTSINDNPLLSSVDPTPLTFTENQLALTISDSISITDLDNLQIQSATVSISQNYTANEDSLAYTAMPNITSTFDASTGVLSLSGPASVTDYQAVLRSVTYLNSSEAPSTLTRSIDFMVYDANAASNAVSRDIDILSVNDAPQGTDNIVPFLEDSEYVLDVTDFGFTDTLDNHALDGIVIAATPAAGQLTLADVPVVFGQLIPVADITAGKLIFTPAENANGSAYDQFRFLVTDNGGIQNNGIDTATTSSDFTFNVINVNDAPSGGDNTISIAEDATHTFVTTDFPFTDALDNDTFTAISILSLPAIGTLENNSMPVTAGEVISTADIDAGLLQYTAVQNGNGIGYAGFTFSVHDSGGNSNNGQFIASTANTITFDLIGQNDQLTVINEGMTVDEGTQNIIGTDVLNATDADNTAEELIFTISNLPNHGELTIDGSPLMPGDTFTLAQLQQDLIIYSHDGSETSTDYFDLQVSDGGEDGTVPVVGRFSLTINEVIDPAPIIDDESLYLEFGQSFDSSDGDILQSGTSALAGTLLSENSMLEIELVSNASNGVVELNEDGTFSYVHNGSAVLQDSFSYSVTNEDGVSAIATVAVSIAPPIANAFGENGSSFSTSSIASAVEATSDTQEEEEEQPEVAVTTEEEPAPQQIAAEVEPEFQTNNTPTNNSEISSEGITDVVQFQNTESTGSDPDDVLQGFDDIGVKQHNKIQVASLDDQVITFSTTSIELLADVTDIKPFDTMANSDFRNSLNQVGEDLDESNSNDGKRYRLANDTAIGVSLGTSAGVLAWVLRGGALFASAMASTPIWSSIDPIRVTGAAMRDEDVEPDEVDEYFE